MAAFSNYGKPSSLSILSKIDANEKYKKVCKKSVSFTGPVVAQRVGRGIALLFHDHGTRRG